MISFVWSDPLPIYSGRGGSESYTVGQVRELMERGIPTRIITVGLGKKDGRDFFPDITFKSVRRMTEIATLDDTIVFVSQPHPIRTKRPSFIVLHCQPLSDPKQKTIYRRALADKTVITNSKFAARTWAEYLNRDLRKIKVVYPFADPKFAAVRRPLRLSNKVPIMYAGRLTPEKGIYIFLEALHQKILKKGFRFSVTTAGNQTPDGKAIEQFLRAHPWVRVVNAAHSPAETARLFARQKVIVMPSNPRYWADPFGYWRECFGMISVEAQHAGCYVVASNDGGLPETDCGGLLLFEPGNSYSLALAVKKAAQAAPLSPTQRRRAAKHFTRAESVDALLATLRYKAE